MISHGPNIVLFHLVLLAVHLNEFILNLVRRPHLRIILLVFQIKLIIRVMLALLRPRIQHLHEVFIYGAIVVLINVLLQKLVVL